MVTMQEGAPGEVPHSRLLGKAGRTRPKWSCRPSEASTGRRKVVDREDHRGWTLATCRWVEEEGPLLPAGRTTAVSPWPRAPRR